MSNSKENKMIFQQVEKEFLAQFQKVSMPQKIKEELAEELVSSILYDLLEEEQFLNNFNFHNHKLVEDVIDEYSYDLLYGIIEDYFKTTVIRRAFASMDEEIKIPYLSWLQKEHFQKLSFEQIISTLDMFELYDTLGGSDTFMPQLREATHNLLTYGFLKTSFSEMWELGLKNPASNEKWQKIRLKTLF